MAVVQSKVDEVKGIMVTNVSGAWATGHAGRKPAKPAFAARIPGRGGWKAAKPAFAERRALRAARGCPCREVCGRRKQRSRAAPAGPRPRPALPNHTIAARAVIKS